MQSEFSLWTKPFTGNNICSPANECRNIRVNISILCYGFFETICRSMIRHFHVWFQAFKWKRISCDFGVASSSKKTQKILRKSKMWCSIFALANDSDKVNLSVIHNTRLAMGWWGLMRGRKPNDADWTGFSTRIRPSNSKQLAWA